MMQARDWVIGAIGVVIGAVGLLSLLKILPFEVLRSILLWIAVAGGLILLYASIVELTNSNMMGTISLIVGGIALIISLLPILNSFGWLGSWAEFKFLGDVIYKIMLVIEGVFLVIATFAMEL